MGETVRVELLQSGFILWLILALMLLLAEIGWRVGNHTAQKRRLKKLPPMTPTRVRYLG